MIIVKVIIVAVLMAVIAVPPTRIGLERIKLFPTR